MAKMRCKDCRGKLIREVQRGKPNRFMGCVLFLPLLFAIGLCFTEVWPVGAAGILLILGIIHVTRSGEPIWHCKKCGAVTRRFRAVD